jgi:hypothetical protein
MPYSISSSNIRKIRYKRREAYIYSFVHSLNNTSQSTTLSISGTSNILFNASVPTSGIVTSEDLLISPKDNTGREAKISLSANPAYLEVFVPPEDNYDRFVMIKKVNVVMPTFTLDSNGKPI